MQKIKNVGIFYYPYKSRWINEQTSSSEIKIRMMERTVSLAYQVHSQRIVVKNDDYFKNFIHFKFKVRKHGKNSFFMIIYDELLCQIFHKKCHCSFSLRYPWPSMILTIIVLRRVLCLSNGVQKFPKQLFGNTGQRTLDTYFSVSSQ